MLELQSIICLMGSHSIICLSTQVNVPCFNPSTRFTCPRVREGWVYLCLGYMSRSFTCPWTVTGPKFHGLAQHSMAHGKMWSLKNGTSLIKRQIIVKFYANIANIWLIMIWRKILRICLYSWGIWTWQCAVFFWSY